MHVQQFRHAVQLILGNLTPDVDVKCVDPTLGGHYTPFPQVRFVASESTSTHLASCCSYDWHVSFTSIRLVGRLMSEIA